MDNEIEMNNAEKQTEEISIQRIFTLLYKRLIWIIIATVLCGLCGTGLAFVKNKPVYTAVKKVMFVTDITTQGGSSTDISLAKMVLPDATMLIKTDKVVFNANEKYKTYVSEKGISGATAISPKSISTSFGDKSLIMKICYSDYSEEAAVAKLEKVIESAKEELPLKLPANVVKLVPVQNEAEVSVENSFYKYVLLGALIGLVLSVCVVLAIEFLDSTVKSKEQLESLTDSPVLSFISDTGAKK